MTDDKDNIKVSDEQRDADSKVDAIAAVGIIFTLAAMAVFWVSSQ